MPNYRWQQQGAVESVEFRENLTHPYAILRFSDGLDKTQLEAAEKALVDKGLVTVRDARDGHAMLDIRGFKTPSHLSNILSEAGLVSGVATIEKIESDKPKHVDTKQWIKDHAIPLAGAFYLLADMMPIAAGMQRRASAITNAEKSAAASDIATGATWALTSIVLMLCGRKNPEFQMGELEARFKEHLRREGIQPNMGDTFALDKLSHKPGFFNSIVSFLYDHPVEFNNTIQAYGGYQRTLAGMGQQNHFKTAAGVAIIGGQTGSMLISENPLAGATADEHKAYIDAEREGKDPPKPKPVSWLSDPLTAIQRAPMTLVGLGPSLNNILLGLGNFFVDRHKVNAHFGVAHNQYELNPVSLFKDMTRSDNDFAALRGGSLSDKDKSILKQHHSSAKLELASLPFNLVANITYGFASQKERSVNLAKDGYLEELITQAANIYSRTPLDHRVQRIDRFAGFLSSQKDIKLGAAEIKKQVFAKMDELGKSHWADSVANNNEASAVKATAAADHAESAASKRTDQKTVDEKPVGRTKSNWVDSVASNNAALGNAVGV